MFFYTGVSIPLGRAHGGRASFRYWQPSPLLKAESEPHAGLLYRFGGSASKKSFTIWTMTGMRSISVMCVVLGNMANLDAERGRMSPKMSSPFKTEHFRDVLQPYAVGIAVDEKHRRSAGLELVGTEIVRFQIHRDDALDKTREFVWRRAQFLVFGFEG
jgi:hypothetical protein